MSDALDGARDKIGSVEEFTKYIWNYHIIDSDRYATELYLTDDEFKQVDMVIEGNLMISMETLQGTFTKVPSSGKVVNTGNNPIQKFNGYTEIYTMRSRSGQYWDGEDDSTWKELFNPGTSRFLVKEDMNKLYMYPVKLVGVLYQTYNAASDIRDNDPGTIIYTKE